MNCQKLTGPRKTQEVLLHGDCGIKTAGMRRSRRVCVASACPRAHRNVCHPNKSSGEQNRNENHVDDLVPRIGVERCIECELFNELILRLSYLREREDPQSRHGCVCKGHSSALEERSSALLLQQTFQPAVVLMSDDLCSKLAGRVIEAAGYKLY